MQLAEVTGQRGPLAQALTLRARLDAACGREAPARAAIAARGNRGARRHRQRADFADAAPGLLELALSARGRRSRHAVEAAERRAGQHGLEEPTQIPWAPDLVEALVRAGRRDDAVRVHERLAEQAANVGTAGAHALAARCAGLVAEDDWDEHFAAASGHHAASPGRVRTWPHAARARGPGSTAHGDRPRPGAGCTGRPPLFERSRRREPGRSSRGPSCALPADGCGIRDGLTPRRAARGRGRRRAGPQPRGGTELFLSPNGRSSSTSGTCTASSACARARSSRSRCSRSRTVRRRRRPRAGPATRSPDSDRKSLEAVTSRPSRRRSAPGRGRRCPGRSRSRRSGCPAGSRSGSRGRRCGRC